MSVSLKLDTMEFTATLRKYAEVCRSKELPDILNTKALFVARGAMRETPKADKTKIRQYMNSTGRAGGPIGAMIVKSRNPKLSGAELEQAVEKLIRGAIRSVAYLKAGWIESIRKLSPLVRSKSGAPALDRSAKQYGRALGSAQAARPGWNPAAWIQNSTASNVRGFQIVAGATQRALNNEAASMRQYIERKLKEAAHRTGIKTN